MPRGDGTGPMGMGTMSGRAMGFCAGFDRAGYENAVPGRGMSIGLGRGCRFGNGGRGWRQGFYATGLPGWMRFGGNKSPFQKPNSEMEKQTLKNQAGILQSQLDQIRKRLGEMEGGVETE